MENTNRTLALLLVAAIIVSLGGTMISLDRLGQLQDVTTGRAVTTGNVSLTVTSSYIINVTDSTIAFGAGSLQELYTDCRVASNSSTQDPAGCGDWNPTGDSSFGFENIGSSNLYLDVQVNSSAEEFVGGLRPEIGFACLSTTGTAYPVHATANLTWTTLAKTTDALYAYVTGTGMYVSRDNGQNWSSATKGLEIDWWTWSFTYSDKNIFLSTDNGVFYSADHGQNWHSLNDGVINQEV